MLQIRIPILKITLILTFIVKASGCAQLDTPVPIRTLNFRPGQYLGGNSCVADIGSYIDLLEERGQWSNLGHSCDPAS